MLFTYAQILPVELLKQIHGDKSQQIVFGSADSIALVVFGDSFTLLLVGPMVGKHCSPLSTDSVWRVMGFLGAFVGHTIGSRVPASP